MRIYAITTTGVVTPPYRSYRSTWAYGEAFHGGPGPVVNVYGKRPYAPLPLRRNLRLTPPVIFPGISMVVDGGVAGRLGVFDGVDLNRCVWEAVYDYPADEVGVLEMLRRFPDMWGTDFGEWRKGKLRSPAPHPPLPPYFEVLAPSQNNLRSRFTCDATLDIPETTIEAFPPVPTRARLHELYPVVRLAAYYLVAERAWRVLEPHAGDPDLFFVKSYEIPSR